MLLNKILSQKLLFLKELAEPPVSDVVFECQFPKRYMITFGEEAGGPGSMPTLLRSWNGIWTKPPRFWPATGWASTPTNVCWKGINQKVILFFLR